MMIINKIANSDLYRSNNEELNDVLRLQAIIKTANKHKLDKDVEQKIKRIKINYKAKFNNIIESVCNKNKVIKSAKQKQTEKETEKAIAAHKKSEIKEYLQIKPRIKEKKNIFKETLMSELAEYGQIKKKKNIKHRLEIETKTRTKMNWYPIFATLTVRDEDEVFKKKSRAFNKYMQNLRREISSEYYGCNKRDALKHENTISYLAVVEKGSKGTKRLHIHILLFIKEIPDYVKKNKNPLHKEIMFKTKWEYGFSSLIKIRTKRNDVWAKRGDCWNKDAKESNIEQVCNYVAKYITKLENTGEKKWRTKMSRKFGMQMIETMTQNQRTLEMMINNIGQTMIKDLELMHLPSNSLMKTYASKKLSKSKTIFNKEIVKNILINSITKRQNFIEILLNHTNQTIMKNKTLKIGDLINREKMNIYKKREDIEKLKIKINEITIRITQKEVNSLKEQFKQFLLM